MNWRPWVVAAVLMAAVIVNTALLGFEEVTAPGAAEGDDISVAATDQLATLRYSPNSRLANLKAMGLPDDIANDANDLATGLMQQRQKVLEKLLVDNNEVSTRVFCAGGGRLPQRYAALSVLVVDEDGVRRVIEPRSLTTMEMQPWYDVAQVPDVFREVELTPDRKADATAMAVAALLLSEEQRLLDGDSPWGSGLVGTWSMGRVLNDYGDRKIRQKLVEYFALMHLLTELANGEGGLCQ